MKDTFIIELYWKRCEDAITQTATKYGKYCFTIAHNIIGNKEDSEECVSDTYMKIWNRIPDERPAVLSAYLGKITRHTALNVYEKKHAQKRGNGELNHIFDELEHSLPSQWSVEKELEAKELTCLLNEFLHQLEKEQRIIFVRRYWYCESIKTISSRYGYSESKIQSILFRVRNRLKKRLEERMQYEK